MIATLCFFVFICAVLVGIWRKLISLKTLPLLIRQCIFLGLLLGLFVSVADVLVIFQIRGLIGDVSITTFLFAAGYLLQVCFGIPSHPIFSSPTRSYPAIALLGFILYPASLGLGSFDVYALGFGSYAMAAFCLLFCLLLIVFKLWVLLGMIWLGTLAHGFGIFASDNLWDYWIDPIAWLASVFYLVQMVCRNFSKPEAVANYRSVSDEA